MTRMPPAPGDVMDVTITKVLPFGVLVESRSGMAGLVRRAAGDVGTTVRVTVDDVDLAQNRFSARPAWVGARLRPAPDCWASLAVRAAGCSRVPR